MRLRDYLVSMSILAICIIISVCYFILDWSVDKQDSNELKTKRFVEFRIDSSFSEEEVFVIQSALRKWEIATNGHLRLNNFIDDVSISEIFDWQEDDYPTIYNAQSGWSWKNWVSKHMNSSPDTIGITTHRTGDIFILDSEFFETVVLHETGHVFLGSWHSDVESELMYPTVGEEKDISLREALFVQIFTR